MAGVTKYKVKNPASVDISKELAKMGIIVCILAIATACLATVLPHWVSIVETLETTVSGLTEATQVTYHYGLHSYCLTMKATLLDKDECGKIRREELKSWELTTLATLVSGAVLLLLSVVQVVVHLTVWKHVRLLITGAAGTSVVAGFVMSAGVSLYQIEATQQELTIGQLATVIFKPHFLGVSFWLGFSACLLSLVTGTLLMVSACKWQRPKGTHIIRTNHYKTTVQPMRFAQRHRQPSVITVTRI